MQTWTIQQWASLASILAVAISAIAVCVRTMQAVKMLEEKIEKLETACESHRNNGELHRGKDYERWLDGKFGGIEDKLDEINALIRQRSRNIQKGQS